MSNEIISRFSKNVKYIMSRIKQRSCRISQISYSVLLSDCWFRFYSTRESNWFVTEVCGSRSAFTCCCKGVEFYLLQVSLEYTSRKIDAICTANLYEIISEDLDEILTWMLYADETVDYQWGYGLSRNVVAIFWRNSKRLTTRI